MKKLLLLALFAPAVCNAAATTAPSVGSLALNVGSAVFEALKTLSPEQQQNLNQAVDKVSSKLVDLKQQAPQKFDTLKTGIQNLVTKYAGKVFAETFAATDLSKPSNFASYLTQAYVFLKSNPTLTSAFSKVWPLISGILAQVNLTDFVSALKNIPMPLVPATKPATPLESETTVAAK